MEFSQDYLSHINSLLRKYPTFSVIVTDDTEYCGTDFRPCELKSGPIIGQYFFPHESRRILSKFARTSMALLGKYLVMNNTDANYEFLAQDQPEDVRLTRTTYDTLSDAMAYYRYKPQMSELLDYYLIIRGYAMTPQARERLRRAVGYAADVMRPMDTVDNLIRYGQLYDEGMQTLENVSILRHAITADFSLNSVISGEAPAEVAEDFDREDDEEVRMLVLWSNLFETAGMAGHMHCTGSRILTERYASDFLTIREASFSGDAINPFYEKLVEPIMATSQNSKEEAVAAIRLARMMGEPELADFIADFIVEKFPIYSKLVVELNHGFRWSHLAERPIVFGYGRNYLSSRYRYYVERGSSSPIEECISQTTPYLLQKMKALRKAAMRDRPLGHLLNLDLSREAIGAKNALERLRYQNRKKSQ